MILMDENQTGDRQIPILWDHKVTLLLGSRFAFAVNANQWYSDTSKYIKWTLTNELFMTHCRALGHIVSPPSVTCEG